MESRVDEEVRDKAAPAAPSALPPLARSFSARRFSRYLRTANKFCMRLRLSFSSRVSEGLEVVPEAAAAANASEAVEEEEEASRGAVGMENRGSNAG